MKYICNIIYRAIKSYLTSEKLLGNNVFAMLKNVPTTHR